MSVNAGEIYVDIAARLDRLDAGLATAKSAAVKGGGEAGGGFGMEFGKRFGEQAKGVVGQLAGPMIAATLAKAAAGVLRSDKSLPDAILDGIKTIPFVGAFADLGSAIYDATFGAADKAAEDLISKSSKARDAILRARGEEEKALQAGGKAALALDTERLSVELANEVLRIKEEQGEIAAANAEFERKTAEQDRATELKMLEDVTDAEFNAYVQLNAQRRKGWELERDAAIRSIEERMAKEEEARQKEEAAKAKAAAEEAKAREAREAAAAADLESARARRDEAKALADGDAERAQELSRQREAIERNAAREKELRDAKSEEEKRAIEERYALEEETAALQNRMSDAASRAANATGSANTALGQFTFDAYPKEAQRATDERIARGVERTAERIAEFGVY